MIEHRHTKRVAVTEEVSVYHRGILVAKCHMKDISTDGMAISAGPLQYRRNTMLEVEISASQGLPASIRLSAMVVYSLNDVLGLMFGHVNETDEKLLRGFIDNVSFKNSAAAHRDEGIVWGTETKRRRAL